MVKHELTSALKQVEQAHLSFGPAKMYGLSIETIGIRRRSAANASRARVIFFSFTSSFFRRASHSPGETIRGIPLLRFVLILLNLSFRSDHYFSQQSRVHQYDEPAPIIRTPCHIIFNISYRPNSASLKKNNGYILPLTRSMRKANMENITKWNGFRLETFAIRCDCLHCMATMTKDESDASD